MHELIGRTSLLSDKQKHDLQTLKYNFFSQTCTQRLHMSIFTNLATFSASAVNFKTWVDEGILSPNWYWKPDFNLPGFPLDPWPRDFFWCRCASWKAISKSESLSRESFHTVCSIKWVLNSGEYPLRTKHFTRVPIKSVPLLSVAVLNCSKCLPMHKQNCLKVSSLCF